MWNGIGVLSSKNEPAKNKTHNEISTTKQNKTKNTQTKTIYCNKVFENRILVKYAYKFLTVFL